jgi:hypothetical protein
MKFLLVGFALAATSTAIAQDRYGSPAQQSDSSVPDLAAPATDASDVSVPSQIKLSAEAPSPTLAPAESLPAGAVLPAEHSSNRAGQYAATKPSELIQLLSQPPVAQPLAGIPVRLAEVVSPAKSRQAQTARAEAYWSLAAATIDHYLALREKQELEGLRQSGSFLPSKEWDTAFARIENRVELSRQVAVAAQQQLGRLLNSAPDAPLPLPSDLPHCGRYVTKYEEIFAAEGSRNPAAEELARLLPLRYEELRQDAAGVDEAYRWLSQVRSGSSEGELLRAHELLSSRRREFVETARNYNREIAAYAQLAAPGPVPPQRLVAMLIQTSATVEGETSAIVPTLAEEPALEESFSGGASKTPQTFASPTDSPAAAPQPLLGAVRREARRPLLGGLRQREHSILRNRPRLRNRLEPPAP